MNRERLKTLRDHLAGLPDEHVDMSQWPGQHPCGTACCVGGWAERIFDMSAHAALGLTNGQGEELFYPRHWSAQPESPFRLTRTDAIAAIDSMLANPDDLALPVWPEKAVSA